MKRSILFSILFFTFSCGLFATQTEIDFTKLPDPQNPKPLSLILLPVSATISETTLSVYFDSPVGNATITVYDTSNNVVTQETVDTNSTSEVFIATDIWASGNYTIKVIYGTTFLIGDFVME